MMSRTVFTRCIPKALQLSIFSVALCLGFFTAPTLDAAEPITDANPMRIPAVGDYGLRIITSNLLELTLITTRPAPTSSSDDAVTTWNFVNPANNSLSAPAAANFVVTVGGSAVSIQSVGFKRRPISAPLYEHGTSVYDLRIGNYLYLQLSSAISNNATVQVDNPAGNLWGANVQFIATNDPMRITPVIHVNQEGYMPGYGKWAEIGYYLGSMGELSVSSSLGFNLVNVANGQTVYSSTLTARPEQGYSSPAPYQNVLEADFSSVTTPGEYQLQVPTLGASYPFVIDSGIAGLFARTYELGLYHSRCDFSNALPYTRFNKGACHDLPTAVPNMSYTEVNGVLDEMATQFGPGAQLAGTPLLTDIDRSLYPFVNTNTVDTHGGHHDAGDYSKYTVDVAQLCHTLLFAVDSLPGVAQLDNLGVPESGDGVPDVLQESLWEIDFLSRLQDTDGGFYFLVYPTNRQYEADVSLVPPDLGDPQCVFPKTTSATAAAVGALAEAGSSPYMKKYFPTNAANYMARAVKGYQFLSNAISKYGRAGSYQTIQQYGNSYTNDDLLAWAAASMFAATGNANYEYDLTNNFNPSNPNTVYWGWWRMYEGYGCAIRDYAFAARSGRLQASQLDNNYLTNCEAQIIACANDNTNWANHSSYHNSFSDAYKSPFNAGWFFSVNQTFDIAVADAITNDPNYIPAMIGNMNYEAGCNPANMPYLTGIGWRRQHDIVSQYSENSFRELPPTGIPLGSVQSGFVYLPPYDSLCGQLTFPNDSPATGSSYAEYAPYDRWADTFNTMTELISWQQGRSLAAMAYLMAQTSSGTEAWQYATATITGLPSVVTNGVPVTVGLSVSGLTMTNAMYVWEATGQDPTPGATFTFVPNTAGANWIEAEATLPDGRRVFATNEFNAISVSLPNPYLSSEYTPDSTMVALYHLDNNWADSSSFNEPNLTPAGGAYLDPNNVSWMADPLGTSLHTMNVGDTATVSIPNSYLWSSATREISVEAMIYVSAYLAYNVGNENIIALEQNWNSTLQFYDQEYAGPDFHVGNNDLVMGAGITNALTPGAWHDLILSLNTDGYTMKVDGTNIFTQASTDLALWGNTSGGSSTLTLGNFSGWIDEVVVRNITTNAVTTNGSGGSGSTPGTPVVSLSIPSGSYAAGANISLTATASVSNGTIASVTFYQNGIELGQALTAPYSLVWGSVPAGTYSVTATATDAAGTSTVSTPVVLTVTSGVSVAAPTISPGAGTYTNSATVTLAGATGATIFYTTDGSAPTANSTVYSAPLTIATNATVNAYASFGVAASTVSTAQFTIVKPSTTALPAPWAHKDIGAVGLSGTSTFANGAFSVTASGTDIWGTADAFQFVSQPWTGKGSIIAKVTSVGASDPWAKAGVMIRANMAADAAQAMTLISSASGGAFQYRPATGTDALEPYGTFSASAPYWVKLSRNGKVFTSYVSTTGTTWTKVCSVSITMPATVYFGLISCAHNNTLLNTSTFSNVRVSSGL